MNKYLNEHGEYTRWGKRHEKKNMEKYKQVPAQPQTLLEQHLIIVFKLKCRPFFKVGGGSARNCLADLLCKRLFVFAVFI